MFFSIRNISNITVVLIIFITIAYFYSYNLAIKSIRSPSYQVISQDKSIEIRRYAPMLIAEVSESGARGIAMKNGFQELASYIFAKNIRRKEQKKTNIIITIPVLQQKKENVGATVTDVKPTANDDAWYIRFVMPIQYTLSTLPRPDNLKIKIYQQPTFNAVVIRFNGMVTDQSLKKHLAILNEYIKTKQLLVTGNPVLVFYSLPWILPFMRRNEIYFAIKGNA